MNYMKDDLFFLDSNILVYAFDNSEKRKQKIAIDLLEKCFNKEKDYVLSSQNLVEFFSIVTKKIENPISMENARDIILKIKEFKGFIKLNYNQSTIIRGIDLLKEFNLKFWDALIISTMLENNVFTIYTENEKDFNKVKNINVINPFK